jgi:TonB family protein
LSVAAHLAVLALVLFRNPSAIDLIPTWLAFGKGANTSSLVYFPPANEKEVAPPEKQKLRFPTRTTTPSHRAAQPRQLVPAPPQLADAYPADQNSRAGSPLGIMIDGPIKGHDVHIAYSVVHPDPPVDRSQLPRDLAGDVVIEVTIDSQGNVVETRILQAIGHGIDEQVEATLRRWHFQPATLDGAPVASKEDVHFHYPS